MARELFPKAELILDTCNSRGRTNRNETLTRKLTKTSRIAFGFKWCADISNSTELQMNTDSS